MWLPEQVIVRVLDGVTDWVSVGFGGRYEVGHFPLELDMKLDVELDIELDIELDRG